MRSKSAIILLTQRYGESKFLLMYSGLKCSTGTLNHGPQQPWMYRPTLSALRVCISLMDRTLLLAGTALLVLAVATPLQARLPRSTQPTMISMERVLFGSLLPVMEPSRHLRVLGMTLRMVSVWPSIAGILAQNPLRTEQSY
jgi:hypothetical protein